MYTTQIEVDEEKYHSFPLIQNRPDYVISKVSFFHPEWDTALVFTVSVEKSYKGCAFLLSTHHHAELEIKLAESMLGWGVEAHIIFYVLNILEKENIEDVRINNLAIDSILVDTLIAMGFEPTGQEDSNCLELTYWTKSR